MAVRRIRAIHLNCINTNEPKSKQIIINETNRGEVKQIVCVCAREKCVMSSHSIGNDEVL